MNIKFTDYLAIENVNKFDFGWQLVRTEAKKIKDINQKIGYVLNFLESNPSPENWGRVHNWLRMTKLGYKEADRKYFDTALEKIETSRGNYNETDTETDLEKIPTDQLRKVYTDLKKRKYGFQFKTVPVAHTEFLHKLEQEIKKRA